MRRQFVFAITAIAVNMLALGSISSFGRQVSTDSERWDIQMIEEARIWKNLLIRYDFADHQRYWPERKAALEKIVHEFPDSRWADDAALILACGKASFENDSAAAISDLEKIAEQYPDGRTIVSSWDPNRGCRFDRTWLTWRGGLVFLNPDGTVRVARPFNRDGQISQMEMEALVYFDHLENYPRATKVVAQLFISDMLDRKGDIKGARAVLEKIVSNSEHYLPVISKADRIVALRPDGYYIRSVFMRPEYRAYLSLIGDYEKQGEVNKAVEMADKLINLCSEDGWLWVMNKHIGDFYIRHGLREKAKEQYQLSMKGLIRHEEDMEKRSRIVEGSVMPDNYWENERRELEERMAGKPR